MKQVLNFVPVDVIPYDTGFVCAKKVNVEETGTKRKFVACDFERLEAFAVTEKTYFRYKFGTAYDAISKQLIDHAVCETASLPNDQTLVVYGNGEVGLFDHKGCLTWSDRLVYNDVPLSSVAPVGDSFWCVAKRYNAVLKYSLEKKAMTYRIGSPDSHTFIEPNHVHRYKNKVYVSCPKQKQVKVIDRESLAVSTAHKFDEEVYKFYKNDYYEIAVLSSGVYLL